MVAICHQLSHRNQIAPQIEEGTEDRWCLWAHLCAFSHPRLAYEVNTRTGRRLLKLIRPMTY
jgi:hypothetical protein